MLRFEIRILLLSYFIIGYVNGLNEIPPFLRVCKKSNPEIKECVIKSVEELRPYLSEGYPEYNIPSVEPIIIKDLIQEESAGLKITTTDVIAHGGSNYIVNDIVIDFDNLKFEVDILLPKLFVDAKYTLDGKLVMVPMKGNGDFYANLTDCSARAYLQAEIYQKDNLDFIRLLDNKMKIKVGGGRIRLENLFGGDKTINDVINDTINKNLDIFIKELMPYIEKGLAQKFLELGNKIVEPYTFGQLFPE